MKNFLIGLGVVAVLGVVVMYFASDPIKTKIDRQVEQATTWTPQNIQKDPEGYLIWSRNKAAKARDSLQAHLIGLVQRKSKAESMLVARSSKADATARVLRELKTAYLASRESDIWPAKVGERLFDEKTLRNRIIDAKSRLDSAKSVKDQLMGALSKINERERTFRTELDRLSVFDSRIEGELEIVRMNQSIKDLESIQIDLAAMTSITGILSSTGDEDSLDSMIEEHQQQKTDDEFEDILSGKD